MRNKKKKAFKGTRRIASHHTNAEIVRLLKISRYFQKYLATLQACGQPAVSRWREEIVPHKETGQ